MAGRTNTHRNWTLEKIPLLLVECRAQAASYGKCVSVFATGKVDLQKGACTKEFEELKQCITRAVKRSAR